MAVQTLASREVVEVAIPTTTTDLERALAPLVDASMVACDIETAGLSSVRNFIISIAIGCRTNLGAYVVVVPYELIHSADPFVQDLVWEQLFRRERRTVYQNGKFDLQFILRWFGETMPWDWAMGDTLLLGFLLDERPRKDRMGSLGLKEQASYRYDQPDYHWDWKSFYEDMKHDGLFRGQRCSGECPHPHPDPVLRADMEGMYYYQSQDVYYTIRLWEDLNKEAMAESPRLIEALDDVLIPASKSLAACEMVGAPIDWAWLEEFESYLERRIARRERALLRAAEALGAAPDFSHGSPKQVADLMYDAWKMTPDMRRRKQQEGPDRSTDKEHIEAAILKYKSFGAPEQQRGAKWLRMLLEWRKDTKMLGTYVTSLRKRADPDGRIRAQFLIHGTSTGRLSSAEPNLQNIPAVVQEKDGTFVERRSGAPTRWPARKLFAPGPGKLWVEADYGQLELRVAAALSQDTAFMQVFKEKRDIHLEVAATMFSKPREEVSKAERFLAKAVDFGIIYGRTAKALANGAEMDFLEQKLGGRRWDEPTAQAFINKFLRGYPQLGAWISLTAANGLRDHMVETPFGRRRRFPFTPRSKWDKLAIERQAVNTPVQSAASDLCLQAMNRVQRRLPEGAHVLFPVHDSICLEVPEELIAEVESICREEMEIDFLGVPLAIDFEYGPSWAEVH